MENNATLTLELAKMQNETISTIAIFIFVIIISYLLFKD
jgi:hypothetical protein